MQRRTLDKPYRRALANYPRHKEEIEQLPRKYDAVLARYPYKRGKYLLEEEDFFQELVLHCEEAELSSGGTFLERACRKIDAELYEQVQKAYRLYNPHRNLYLDKCYGESKRPLSEWMDFTKYFFRLRLDLLHL